MYSMYGTAPLVDGVVGQLLQDHCTSYSIVAVYVCVDYTAFAIHIHTHVYIYIHIYNIHI